MLSRIQAAVQGAGKDIQAAVQGAGKEVVKISASTSQQLHAAIAGRRAGGGEYVAETGGRVFRCGPGNMWVVVDARSRRGNGEMCSLWLLDKAECERRFSSSNSSNSSSNSSSSSSSSRSDRERLTAWWDLNREGMKQLTKLRHPSFLQVRSPLEENKTSMAVVTERVECSLVSAGLEGSGARVVLSAVEIKWGIRHIAEGVLFAGGQGGMVVRGVSPSTCVISQNDGRFCIAFMGWAVNVHKCTRDDLAMELWTLQKLGEEAEDEKRCVSCVPHLAYLAPECLEDIKGVCDGDRHLGAPVAGVTGPAADAFSLAATLQFLMTGCSPLGNPTSVEEYHRSLRGLQYGVSGGGGEAGGGARRILDTQCASCVQEMLVPASSMRGTVESFVSCSWLREDKALAALVFLEGIVQQSQTQRVAFLKELPSLLATYDSRIVSKRVVPTLLEEMRREEMAALVLPLVLAAARRQTKEDIATVTMPALVPRMNTIEGEELIIMVRHAGMLSEVLPIEIVQRDLFQMLCRALQGPPHVQSQALAQAATVAKQLDAENLHQVLLPAMHRMALSTTDSSLRLKALAAMSAMVPVVRAEDGAEMMTTVQRIVGVDTSPVTVMSAFMIGTEVGNHFGAAIIAKNVLPVLIPLLMVTKLSGQQFDKAMAAVRKFLAAIEEKRNGSSAGKAPATALDNSRQENASWQDTAWVSQTRKQPPPIPMVAPSSSGIAANGTMFANMTLSSIPQTTTISQTTSSSNNIDPFAINAPMASFPTSSGASAMQFSSIPPPPPMGVSTSNGMTSQKDAAQKSAADQLSDLLSGNNEDLFCSQTKTYAASTTQPIFPQNDSAFAPSQGSLI